MGEPWGGRVHWRSRSFTTSCCIVHWVSRGFTWALIGVVVFISVRLGSRLGVVGLIGFGWVNSDVLNFVVSILVCVGSLRQCKGMPG